MHCIWTLAFLWARVGVVCVSKATTNWSKEHLSIKVTNLDVMQDKLVVGMSFSFPKKNRHGKYKPLH